MKKFLPILLLAFVSLFIFSCDDDNNNNFVDHDTIATAYDFNSPIFVKQNSNLYRYTDQFNTPLIESDVVLMYIQTGTVNNSPVWKLLPYTYYVGNANNDAVDYTFDFSKFDIAIYVNSTSTLNLDNNSSYYTGKRFRVVVVPANTGKNSTLNYNDYNSVIKYYNIDESKIKALK